MEEGVNDRNDDKNEKNDQEKEAECLDKIFPVDVEEGVNDRNDDKNEKNDEEKEAYKTKDSEITTIGAGKGVINERGGKDVDLDYLVSEFDASTCSGDNFYDIFENVKEIITESSILWVKTNKTIWEGRFIKTSFSHFTEVSNI